MVCIVIYYNLMGSPSYMRSVADRNVVMRRITVLYNGVRPVAYRGGVWGVHPPPPEIPKISVESSIA